MSKSSLKKLKEVVLVGNPNSGKTTLFNALTGLRHQTANYPGVTVEKKSGVTKLGRNQEECLVLDLPGTYSLLPRSMDEEIVHNVLLGIQEGTSKPDCAIVILDAANFERNMYLASQVMETGLPTVLVLNMWDLAEANGVAVDLDKLSKLTGCPCVKTVGNKGKGILALKEAMELILSQQSYSPICLSKTMGFPAEVEKELNYVEDLIKKMLPWGVCASRGEALRMLSDVHFRSHYFDHKRYGEELKNRISIARAHLDQAGIDWTSLEMEKRYEWIENLCRDVLKKSISKRVSISERIDKVLTHRIWGFVFFAGLMALIFQSIFTWALGPMDWMADMIETLAGVVARILPDGQLKSLVIDGVIAGVGNVIIFLPQIFLLFFFIAFFEDSGYMARAAFVLDRVMKKVGLNGKAFLPLLGSFACAVPGIMATRTIEDRKDRLVTILVAPLMSCSARLPIYTLMIGAFVPAVPILGFINLKGMTLFSMYFLSIFAGLGMAAFFRNSFFKGNGTPFVFELPPYRIPNLRTVLWATWDRGKEFIVRAGTIIFSMSILLWFLVSYPRHPMLERKYEEQRTKIEQSVGKDLLGEQLRKINAAEQSDMILSSFAGKMGRLIEPVIAPLGFDWKIGIGIIGSFAAREVFVSTLAIVYNVGDRAEGNSVDLIHALRKEVSPVTGKAVYSPLVAVTIMVFFVLGCQCLSTVAIVRSETRSWRWPIFMVLYMSLLAWLVCFFIYQGGRWLGWG
ncbi:MAG: ferrous iron transport protein B [Candidatus Omnitrophica bacterium]|nr:ferrous iron transport protein B [Candidatus Omnitrophota bacterium]